MAEARPQDPFERWLAWQASSNDTTNRLDETTDLAFWERAAANYDAGALARRVPAILERVLNLVPRNSAVLEVGAGTGAFTLPIARRAAHVTALDYSPAMLQVLRRNLAQHVDITNVRVLQSRWEEAQVQPHDVVLAANALYRVGDLHQALGKFVAAARTRGIVVWSIGRATGSHEPGYRPGPDYIHLLDGLFALDVFAHVEIIERVAIIWWDAGQ